MSLSSFYPVVQVVDPATSAAFFVEHLDFETTFETDWYISLRRGHHEIAFLRCDHPTIPEGFRHPSRGLLVNVEVDDADAEHRRLVGERRLDVRLQLRDEAFGQRHFIVEAPGGLLVDVIEEIEPAPEFAAAYDA